MTSFCAAGGNRRGFTLIEMAIGILIMGILGGALYGILIQTNQGERMGSTVSEAQQNARRAIDVILKDLRESGFAVNTQNQVPIEVASEFRITFVVDRNADGDIDPGERVTYFLDKDASDPIVTETANPHDVVMRKVTSTAVDSLALPAEGKGTVVAYGVTQHATKNPTRTPNSGGSSLWNVRLFEYLDDGHTSLLGSGSDPAGASYGKTVPDSSLGKPAGGAFGNDLRAVRVDLVTEGNYLEAESNDYPMVRVTGTINPRNMNLGDRAVFFTERDIVVTEEGEDTTGTGGEEPPVEEIPVEPELPPYEPPIHIPTERVLTLTVTDLREEDSLEGSLVTESNVHDWDIVAGTAPSGANNIAVWFEGYPDRYASGKLYNGYPNYLGTTSRTLNELDSGDLNQDGYPDVAVAVQTAANTGGFEIWFNQGATHQGWLGTGTATTAPSVFYTQTTGAALDVELSDIENGGYVDVIIGTRTGSCAGKIEIWSKNDTGEFVRESVLTAAGEVNALAIADFNGDGMGDIAAGTKTATNDKTGKIEVWIQNSTGNLLFTKKGQWNSNSGGKVTALAAGAMDDSPGVDLVAGTKTGNGTGKVEVWFNDGTGNMTLGDEAAANNVVTCVALGQLDLGNGSLDIVAGNEGRSIQAWFCDPSAATNNAIVPQYPNWSDANVGGIVHDVEIRKLEASWTNPQNDLLNDIVAGTSINASSGEVVLYMNPYVWTLQTP